MACFLLAINPNAILYSQTARMYSLETMLGVVFFFLTSLLYQQSPPQKFFSAGHYLFFMAAIRNCVIVDTLLWSFLYCPGFVLGAFSRDAHDEDI